MKTKERIFAIIALTLNILIVGSTFYGLFVSLKSAAPDYFSMLKTFTIDSNILLGIAALLMIPNNVIKIFDPERPYSKFFKNFKFVAVVAITITLITVLVFLAPLQVIKYNSTYYWMVTGGTNIKDIFLSQFFHLHTFAPFLGIVSIIFDKDSTTRYKTVLYGFLPLAVYIIPYIVFAVTPSLKAKYNGDWYGFIDFNILPNKIVNTIVLVLIAAVAMSILNLIIGTGIWGLTLIKINVTKRRKPRISYVFIGNNEENNKNTVVENPNSNPSKEKSLAETSKKVDNPVKEEYIDDNNVNHKQIIKEEKKVAVAKKPAPAAKKTAPAKKPVAPVKKEAPAKKPVAAKKPAAKKEEPAKYNGKARVYHISQHENGFKVKLAGGDRAIKTFRTQKEAIAYAKELVKTQGGTYLIHSLDGTIRKG